MPIAELFNGDRSEAEPKTTKLSGRRPTARMALLVTLSSVTVVVLGLIGAIWSALPSSDCSDPRQDCDKSQGDVPLPEALQRFSLSAPCGTKDLHYAYFAAWNDGSQALGLHATLTEECTSEFVAQIAPSANLSVAKPLRPGDPDFPIGTYPNGPYGPVSANHTYLVVTARQPTQDVMLLIDTSTPSPVINAIITKS